MRPRIVRTFFLSATVGIAIAFALSVFWRLVNFDYIVISNETQDTLSGLAFFFCPPSFVLMEVGPREAIKGEVAGLYAEVILLNGVLYGLLAVLGVVLFRTIDKRTRDIKDQL